MVNGRPGDQQVAAVSRSIRDDGGAAEGFCADVTDEHQVGGLVTAIADCFGPVDVLVLNATGPQPEAAVTDVTWADDLAQLDFFVKSPVLLGRAVLPGMQDRRYGRIVHIDSEVAHRPPPGRSAYATAKLASVPAGRMGTPGDIASAVSFLASEDAGFITGQRIVVDGGRSLGS